MLVIFLSVVAAVCLCLGLSACGGEEETHTHTIVSGTANEVAATCTKDGSYENITYCSECGAVFTREQVTVPATGHTWDSGVVTREATCTQTGKITYTCSTCGETKTETTNSLGHTLTSEVTKEATCTSRGEITYTCSVCGLVHVAYTDMLEHTLVHVDATQATEDEGGNIEYWQCSDCGRIFSDSEAENQLSHGSETTSKLHNHTFVYVAAVAESCTTDGNVEYWYCSDCGKIYLDSAGKYQTTLADVTISATGHTIQHVDAVAATCTTDGNIEYWYCTDCGAYFSDSECTTQTTLSLVTITGSHTLTHVDAKDATATEDGNVEYWYCTVCLEYFLDSDCTIKTTADAVIIEAGHTHTLVHVDAVAATCTETGNIEYWYCSDCGVYFSDSTGTTIISKDSIVTAKLGHTRYHYNAVAATCTTDGNVEYWYCTTCGKYFSDRLNTETTLDAITVKATGHSLTHLDAVDATCTTDGNIDCWYCSNCNKYFSDDAATTEIATSKAVIAALGHKLTNIAPKAATDSEDGNVEYWYCSVCGKYFLDSEAATETTADAVIISAGHTHTLEHFTAVAKTCTTDGNEEYWCCAVCGLYFSDEAATTLTTASKVFISATGHNYSYYSNENGHWQVCSNCNDTTESEYHTYSSSNVCSVCNYTLENSLYYTLSSDGTSYVVSGMGSCTSDNIVISETFNDLPVTEISEKVFMNNTNIKYVTIPASVIKVDFAAFHGCTALETVTFLADTESKYGLVTIEQQAFDLCTSLDSVDFANRVGTIGYQSFYGCTGLKKVLNCTGLTTIGISSFNRCSSLKYFNSSYEECIIPDSVTTIELYAFKLTGLTSVTIGSGVTSIGVYAFDSCSSLTNVTFAATTGWYVTTTEGEEDGTPVTVTAPATNATNLTSTYVTYYWYKATTTTD